MFSKNKKSILEDFCNEINKMIKMLLEEYCKERSVIFEQTSELERQILAVYAFGMAEGMRQTEYLSLNIMQVESGIIGMLNSVFQYSIRQAQDFTHIMITNLKSKDPENTYYAIIHRGLDGYYLWKDEKKKTVINDIVQIINVLQ